MGVRIWFAASSLAVVALLIVAAFQDYNTDWRRLQNEYKERALAKERVFSVRDLIENAEVAVHQEYLEGLHRIDRCATCHLGIENPKMAGAPQPFAMHPGELLKTHSPQKFGCTICHGGQGLATSTKAAHGRVKHWHEPLFDPRQIEASCGTCHHDENLEGTQRLNEGRRLFAEHGCLGCHRVRGRGQNVGPDLSTIREKDFTGDGKMDSGDWEWNIEHLIAPKAKVPSSIMPSFGLSRRQAEALTVYLYSLTDRDIAASYLPPRGVPIEPISRVGVGRRVYLEYGCGGCHGTNGEGGHLNPNSQSGGQVPALAKVKEGYLRDQLITTIKHGIRTAKMDPNGPPPPLNMPAWKGHIADEKLDLLVDYLFSLAPETEEDDWDD